MGGPWPAPPHIVEYVCPFDGSLVHFKLHLDAVVPEERVEELMIEHLDAKHPGWTEEQVYEAGARQRQADPSLRSARAVRSLALR